MHHETAQHYSGGTKPVEGLAATLPAEVTKDGQTRSLTLEPKEDGVYEGLFVPTATGDYTFHITGTIGKATVDESATSGPNTFDTVQPLSTIEFPITRPDRAQIEALAAEAQADVATARMLGLVGIAVGVLALILGGVALARSRHTTSSSSPAESRPVDSSGKLIR